jgi:hypothetical protein
MHLIDMSMVIDKCHMSIVINSLQHLLRTLPSYIYEQPYTYSFDDLVQVKYRHVNQRYWTMFKFDFLDEKRRISKENRAHGYSFT